MYTTASDICIKTYPDNWNKGRYRVELCVEPDLSSEDIDIALQKLGYEVVDADQCGLSYSNNENSKWTAELDQVGEGAEYTRLKLANADLDEASVQTAADYLVSIYDRICQLALSQNQEFNDSLFDYPIFENDQNLSLHTYLRKKFD